MDVKVQVVRLRRNHGCRRVALQYRCLDALRRELALCSAVGWDEAERQTRDQDVDVGVMFCCMSCGLALPARVEVDSSCGENETWR